MGETFQLHFTYSLFHHFIRLLTCVCVCVCPLVGTEMCRDGRRKRASSRGGSYQQGGMKFMDGICTHKLVQLYVEGRVLDKC